MEILATIFGSASDRLEQAKRDLCAAEAAERKAVSRLADVESPETIAAVERARADVERARTVLEARQLRLDREIVERKEAALAEARRLLRRADPALLTEQRAKPIAGEIVKHYLAIERLIDALLEIANDQQVDVTTAKAIAAKHGATFGADEIPFPLHGGALRGLIGREIGAALQREERDPYRQRDWLQPVRPT